MENSTPEIKIKYNNQQFQNHKRSKIETNDTVLGTKSHKTISLCQILPGISGMQFV